ncbi:MAG: Omp28-related outer membrane protein [Fimbriimonadaceae bacterium]|nr:Omp28-related outer membrane protein [Chitinophagales bacterium]
MKKLFTFIVFTICFITVVHAQTILIEDFESGTFPLDWSQETAATDGGWITGNSTDLSSSGFPIPAHTEMIASNDDACNCNKLNDILKTPSMDLSTYSNVLLSFDVFYAELAYDSYENATVEVSTDGGYSWSIVKDLTGLTAWRTENVYLGDYAGESDVMIAINYTDDGGWAYGIAVDNFEVYEAAPVVDVTLTSITTYQFQQVGDEAIIAGVITNNGTVPVTSFDITWSDGVMTYTDNITGINLNPFEAYSFEHSTAYTPASAITYDLDIEVANPNSTTDENIYDNTNIAKVSGCSYIPPKHVIAEEATGTWCGWCPRGAIFMDQMAEDYPDTFIGIAVHNSDPMEVTAYDAEVGSFPGFSGYPSVIADRNVIVDPSQLPDWYDTRIDDVVPVDVTIEATYDEASGEGTANVNAEFVTQLDNIDYRFNFILTEDNVTGSAGGYNQTNYYAGGAYGEMGGYEDLPASVPADQMVYNHVARYLAEDWDGTEESISENVVASDISSYTYTFEADEDWDLNQMHAIVIVTNAETGEILNAASVKLTVISSVNSIAGINDIDLYPNPASDFTNLMISLSETKNISINITDLNGKTVTEKNYGQLSGAVLLPINTVNYSAGIYIINIVAGDEHTALKLVIIE